jgi:hypothetical protein
MSDMQDDPLLGLLTDIAEGVAALSARVDGIETRMAAQDDVTNQALATIAEIVTRIYYASKPSSALPDDIINANVMDAMIERWPSGAVIGMSNHDRQLMSELDRHPIEAIDRLIARAEDHPDQSNANRLRMGAFLVLLKREKDKRAKAKVQDIERDAPGRSR